MGQNTFLGLMDTAGVLIEANRPALLAAGLQAEDVLGLPFDQTYWWSYSESARVRLREAIASALTGEIERYDVQVRVAGDALMWIDFTLNPVRDEQGRVIFVVPSGSVVDERVRAEADYHKLNAELELRVRERTQQLESANKELEAFSYSVSHDLRAPLRAVDGFSQAVLEDYGAMLPEDGRQCLVTIREGAQRMGALIDDLLTFSRLSRLPITRQTVDMERQVRETLRELKATQKGRELELQIGELPAAEGDAALLKQVWVNLLSNALKYTGKRERAIVEIGSLQRQGRVVYYVRDNGTGFDMRYAHKLFGVFQRLHRQEEFEGTGVGLAIVQRIVHRHGGQIWAESALEQGATFSFTLGVTT